MKRKYLINTSFGIVTLILSIWVILSVFIEPWIGKKIETVLNETNKDYTIKIGKVNVSIIRSSIGLENIRIYSKELSNMVPFSLDEITFVKFKGIGFMKVLFKNEINIRDISISNFNIKGKIPFLDRVVPPIVSPYTIRIGSISFNKIDFAIENSLDAQSYSTRDGVLKLYDFHINKQDTLSLKIINQFDFESKEFISISADSMYTYKIDNIRYSTSSKILGVNKLSIHPNYKDYDFTSRFKFQTNRFEVECSEISALNVNANSYFKYKSIISSYIEIGRMEMAIFRDKRKKFKHLKKPTIQDMLYGYHGVINIDSIGLLNGNISYTVHADKANQPGNIGFNEIHAKIFKVTNDTSYKAKEDHLVLNANAMLMGKSKLSVLLKSKLFDNQNTFSVNGNLASLDINYLNPILEKTVFVYATAGMIDAMSFSFNANNTKASGELKMLYHGLKIAIKNKRTDDTTAIAERFISIIANSIILDSNPTPGKEVRIGNINYERDPEKFLFNYCFKSILSGIEATLTNSQKKGK